MFRLNTKEEEVMSILWKLRKAFPKEVIELIKPPKPPYNTILSMIRKLEENGYIDYKKIGKSHQYFPKISKLDYQKSILKHLVNDYFGGSPERLLSFFIKEENLSEQELNDIIAEFKKDTE